MSTNRIWGVPFLAAAFVSTVVTVAAAGDRQYFDRSDSITPGVGDAVARNVAIQTVDPWPRYVQRRKIDIDGDRIGLAARRYKSNQVIPPVGIRTQSIISIGGN